MAAHRRRLPSEWGKAETGPTPDPSPSPGGAGRGPTGLGTMAPAASPRVREGPRLFVSHPTPQVPPGPFCRPRRRGAPDTLSQRPVGVRPGSSAPAHDRRARHCLTPRGGRGSAHSHFRGEFWPGPSPSLASVHTASLAPHGPRGYRQRRAHTPALTSCSRGPEDYWQWRATQTRDAHRGVTAPRRGWARPARSRRGLGPPETAKRSACGERGHTPQKRGPSPRE